MSTTLRINGDRLNSTLQSTCSSWGAIPNSTGMRRLALNQDDKAVRDWLVSECKSLGCEVKIDQMGNIFAIRPGTSKDKKPIGMGSHLDTQPAGGRYDGILGVQSALEVLRILHENNVETFCPIALIDWTNEEGARFPGAMMASGVWSTKSSTDLNACYGIKDISNVLVREALQEIGYLGETPCDYRQNGLQSYFELHIEQGPLLEAQGKKVGIVTGVQGMKWLRINVTGLEGHAGTQPMDTRSDALVTASKLITAVNSVALETRLGVATVGVITSATQAQSTIPSSVTFIIDIRCPSDILVSRLSTAILESFDAIVAAENNSTAYKVVGEWALPESVFDEACIDAVRKAAVSEVSESGMIDMRSGAGHDAAWTSKVVPSTMIFVPSKEGISHNPNEYTSPEDCALGAQVLLNAVLGYDEKVKKSII